MLLVRRDSVVPNIKVVWLVKIIIVILRYLTALKLIAQLKRLSDLLDLIVYLFHKSLPLVKHDLVVDIDGNLVLNLFLNVEEALVRFLVVSKNRVLSRYHNLLDKSIDVLRVLNMKLVHKFKFINYFIFSSKLHLVKENNSER